MTFKWECPDCRVGGAYRFLHISGTIFENTNKPLREWFRVIHMMLTSKKGIAPIKCTLHGFRSKRLWPHPRRPRKAGDCEVERLVGARHNHGIGKAAAPQGIVGP